MKVDLLTVSLTCASNFVVKFLCIISFIMLNHIFFKSLNYHGFFSGRLDELVNLYGDAEHLLLTALDDNILVRSL